VKSFTKAFTRTSPSEPRVYKEKLQQPSNMLLIGSGLGINFFNFPIGIKWKLLGRWEQLLKFMIK